MKKKEALSYIRKHKGYVPYVAMFELYQDDDDIPDGLINMEIEKDPPAPGSFLICSAELAEQLNEIKNNIEDDRKI